MLKIGDKVKFNEYMPKNMVTNTRLRVTLDKKERIRYTKSYVVVKSGDTIRYRACTFVTEEPLSGIYLGYFRLKLVREYRKTEPLIQEEFDIFDGRVLRANRERARGPVDRYSTSPARMDNVRKLDEVAMIRVKQKVIAVPMSNLKKCTYGHSFRTI